MERIAEPLTMYGERSELAVVDWPWATEQLARAGAYWLTAPTATHPHPRPVWGVWHRDRLHLSIGSPALQAATEPSAPVTVHLGHDTDVVIVEGEVAGPTTDRALVDAYDTKYDWSYSVDEYGPLTTIQPRKVLAWRSAGWAGRGGFQAAGRWRFRSV
ncbi:MAG: hypothetical protein AAFZ07_29210 [Actinomycetota bacterium]